MGNRTNYGTGRMTVDNRQKNERSRSGNPYSSHVKAGKHAGTVYNFKRKSRIRKSLTRLPILLEFIHKYIFLNFVSFYNGLNSNLTIRKHQERVVRKEKNNTLWAHVIDVQIYSRSRRHSQYSLEDPVQSAISYATYLYDYESLFSNRNHNPLSKPNR